MAEKPRQGDKTLLQNGALHNTWIRLAILVGILLATALLVALGILVRWYFTSDLPITERKDLVQGLASTAQALAVFLTGTVGLIGLYFTWRNLRQARESAQETLRLTEEGQITERFTRAIDLLGSDHLGIRLGAIYALERIARDSERDHWPIMEVLTTYVRLNAPWTSEERARDSTPSSPPTPQVQRIEATESQQAEGGFVVVVPVPDIQAVMTVLRRRSRYYGNGEDERLDLFAADLGAVDLRGAHLERASFAFSNLSADLEGAHLEGADLVHANLKEAALEGAHLEGARLIKADLQEASLKGAFLHGATLIATEGLTQEQIEQAHGDWQTKLPEGLNRPASWTERPEEQPNE